MSSSDHPVPRPRASERFAHLFGLPAPQPLPADEEAAYQRMLDDARRAQTAVTARLNQHAA